MRKNTMTERYLPTGPCDYCKESGPLRVDTHGNLSCIPCIIDKESE